MRICLQRVSRASVSVSGEVTGKIDGGYLLLLGVSPDDGLEEIELLSAKVANLRILDDENGVMNRSALDVLSEDPRKAGILVVSQFTLYADVRKGRRPSWTDAAPPTIAEPLVKSFCDALRGHGFDVQTGVFGAEMAVELINDGPVTIWLDSDELENRGEDDAVKEPEAPETNEGEPEAMRPIPDGGLQQSMPEWLGRPPAWRNLPKKETPAGMESVSSAPSEPAALPAQAAPPLLDPDTSEIDPRSLVDVADLPQWLQDIAAERTPAEQSAPPVTTDVSDHKETDMTDRDRNLEHEPAPERTVAFEPVDKKKWEAPEKETKVYDGKPKQGIQPQLLLLLGVAVIAILLIILIIVL